METLISSLQPQLVFDITHASDVAAARRAGQRLAGALGFDDVRAGRLAIVVTEAGTNILKHAGEGRIYIMPSQTNVTLPGIDVVAIDRGPGIADVAFSIRDGVSTAGTAGNGLGALRRQSDEFDVWTVRGKGAAFFMRIWSGAAPAQRCGIEIGAVCVPLAGEEACGDGWAMACDLDGATLLGVDGLGHGPDAAKAAYGAIDALERRPASTPSVVVQEAHDGLRITRGAALAVARVDYGTDMLHFAGVGNVAGVVIDGDGRRALVSHNGIVGHNMRKVQEFSLPCPAGALCVLHSDGLQTQWNLADYPGLQGCMPVLVAAVLMRDFSRGRDDAMVLVGRRRERHS
jgi:anti-sigma regulatory factor (Ser/Thr protein kinase)